MEDGNAHFYLPLRIIMNDTPILPIIFITMFFTILMMMTISSSGVIISIPWSSLLQILTPLHIILYTALGFLVTVYIRYKTWKYPFRLWQALLVLLLWPLWVMILVGGFLHFKKI